MKQLKAPLYIVGKVNEEGLYEMPLRYGGYSGIRIYRRLGMAKEDQRLNGGEIFMIKELEEYEATCQSGSGE